MTKQADNKAQKQLLKKSLLEQQVIDVCNIIREEHRVMGCRKIYCNFGQDIDLGRDAFMTICCNNGLFIRRKRNPVITTISIKENFAPNLIDGLKLNGINQVWQSDLFYFNYQGKHWYGFTIIDVYSRKLLALHVADNMRAESLETAIKKAFQARKGHDLSGCIFHSDRGTQYFSEKVKKLIKDKGMKRSMALRAQQNAYAERVQGTVKHEYLDYMRPEYDIKKMFQKTIELYNTKRPHQELDMNTPQDFEEEINKRGLDENPELHIYQWVEKEFTIVPLPNKKEKRSKKEKSTITLVEL